MVSVWDPGERRVSIPSQLKDMVFYSWNIPMGCFVLEAILPAAAAESHLGVTLPAAASETAMLGAMLEAIFRSYIWGAILK